MMSLKEDTGILNLQERYQKLGSVVELCAFDILEPTEVDYELSRMAAVTAMDIFKVRNESEWRNRNPGLEMEEPYLEVFGDIIPKGERITFAEFLGAGYDLKNRQIDMFNYSENVRASKTAGDGLAHALLDPPYSLRLMESGKRFSIEYGQEEQKRMTILFNEFLTEVLRIQNTNNTDHLVIYKWSDDWSSYFDLGKEWWGTFYWSILDKGLNKITIIAASTTD